MSVRRVAITATLSAFAWTAGIGAIQAAQTRSIQFFGIWQGGEFSNDQSHQFDHCGAWAPYKSGITMHVSVTRTYGWMLGFVNPAWTLTLGAKIPLVITFDSTSPWSGTANVIDSHIAVVPMQDDSTLIGLFRGAHLMTIDVGSRKLGFALDGTSRLLVSLSRCVASALAVERGEPRPTYANEAVPPKPTRSVTPPAPVIPQSNRTAELELEMAATRIASNLLLQAKLPNARLLTPAEVPANLKGRGAAWTSDAGLGAVELLSAEVGKDPQQVASLILSDDASHCKGDFVSGRSSDLVDARVVTKATSLCRDSDGQRTYRYFIFQADPAGYVVYALSGPSGTSAASAPAPIQDAEFQAAAVKAAFSVK